jgi:hypothetical protein
MAAMFGAWLRRKVRHPWLGDPSRVREPDATMQPAPQNIQLMSKPRSEITIQDPVHVDARVGVTTTLLTS